MAAPVNKSPRESALFRARIAELVLNQWTTPEIAEVMGVTEGAIAYHIKILTTQWRQQSSDLIAQARAQLIVDMQRANEELWLAWEQSKAILSRNGQEVQQLGRAEYLREVRENYSLLAKVLGLEAPKRLTVEGGRTLSSKRIREMSTEELKALQEKILEREEGEISSTESWEREQREGLPAGRAEVAADVSNSSNRDPESTGG